MLVDTYNQKGEKLTKTRLPEDIFGLKMNSDLVHQVLVSQQANKRQNTAHSKGRGNKRGGGRKPWRQKGTGRARHGSIRSPIWRGGGVTFGPTKEKVFKKKIPKKMRRKALFMVLSKKAKNKLVIVLNKLEIEDIKTKKIAEILEKLPVEKENCLIALPSYNKNVILSARNLPQIDVIEARNLNVLDLLSFKYLLMPKEAIKKTKETFLKKEK